MRTAKELRQAAWKTLTGKYWWAVLAALIAAVLGGTAYAGGFRFEYRFDLDSAQNTLQSAWEGAAQSFRQLTGFFSGVGGERALGAVSAIVAALGGIAVIYGVAAFLIGSAVELGYRLFNVSLYESAGKPRIETLFSRFHIFGRAVWLRFLTGLKIFLWTLLLIIPGIVAAYRYALAPYLLAEQPELTASEAIRRSKELMSGHKGRLCVLHLSFIGWWLLSLFTGGLGQVFLAPYVHAAETAFYLERTGRLPLPDAAAAPQVGEQPDHEMI